LALGILLDYFEEPELAMANYQQFKWDVIAVLPQNQDFTITSHDIDDWIESQQDKPYDSPLTRRTRGV
jgi:hypothetical protein